MNKIPPRTLLLLLIILLLLIAVAIMFGWNVGVDAARRGM